MLYTGRQHISACHEYIEPLSISCVFVIACCITLTLSTCMYVRINILLASHTMFQDAPKEIQQ